MQNSALLHFGAVTFFLMCNLYWVTSIRCFTDNQGIPVEEAPFIIPRFKVGF